MALNTNQYIEFIREAIKTEGIKVADTANKLALEMKAITLDQYRQAARILVDAYLAQ
jgi:hypothetical protein